MYVIEINNTEKNWIVALCREKKKCGEYFDKLPEALKHKALKYEIPINDYPLFIIENCSDYQPENYFEFTDIEGLNEKVKLLKGEKQDSDYVYFRYYYRSRDYFQLSCESDFMLNLEHTEVTNEIVESSDGITLFGEKIDDAVYEYSLDKLDSIFEKCNSDYEKNLLAEGYQSLFWTMNYDYACGKIYGIEELNPMVDKIENLTDKKHWNERSTAKGAVFEHSAKSLYESAGKDLDAALESYKNYLRAEPEETTEILRCIALCYQTAFEYLPENSFKYWLAAVKSVLEAIEIDPLCGSWSLYLKLIYVPVNDNSQELKNSDHDQIAMEQRKAQNKIKDFINSNDNGDEAYSQTITSAFNGLRDTLEWNKNDLSIFPESLYIKWLNRSAYVTEKKSSIHKLLENASFLRKEGVRYNRLDLIENAIKTYKSSIDDLENPAFEIHYCAESFKDMSKILRNTGDTVKTDEALQSAIDIYSRNLSIVKSNYSVYSHYSVFMEYCYLHDGNVSKLTLEELEEIAKEVEKMGDGYYSTPIFLRMRLALYRRDEDKAIHLLTKALIAFELCIDKDIDKLIELFKNSPIPKFNEFLSSTRKFFKLVRKGYYLNTELKWKQIESLSFEEINSYWSERMEFLKNRKPLDMK
ncbi:MAG: hypothetical protein GY760_26815 [Deltaproteobacteria bacterium]|nr:hypothetical protein [Deltaproteobacteria bacterium]